MYSVIYDSPRMNQIGTYNHSRYVDYWMSVMKIGVS